VGTRSVSAVAAKVPTAGAKHVARLSALTAIGSATATLLADPAPEHTSINAEVSRNVRNGGAWLLAQVHRFMFKFVREAPSGSCQVYLLNTSCHWMCPGNRGKEAHGALTLLNMHSIFGDGYPGF